MRYTKCCLLLTMMALIAPRAMWAGAKITNLEVSSDGDGVRISVELTEPVKPTFWAINQPCRLIFDFAGVAVENQARTIPINNAGISEARVEMLHGTTSGARISIGMDTLRRFGIRAEGSNVVLSISPQPLLKNNTCAGGQKTSSAAIPAGKDRVAPTGLDREVAIKRLAQLSRSTPPEVTHVTLSSGIDEKPAEIRGVVRRRFKIRFVSGDTVYINGGSNAGLRVGMNLDIRKAAANSRDGRDDAPIAAARVIGIATTSAVLEIGSSSEDLKAGDWADLLPGDANAARLNVITGPDNTIHANAKPVKEDSDAADGSVGQAFRPMSEPVQEMGTRAAGRFGLDYSGISSTGSTPGSSFQVGMLFQSDIRHILGSHWNLEGYWRGRINRHSQFLEPTIDESLSKTYTMQLYYDNPQSHWVAGMGRLYLPWAVSLDTVDGGYFGRKFPLHNTTGFFAGSTPDLSSWHYRPNQRIGGVFTNFEGGDYDRFHYSSTTGVALTSIKWQLDRPFAFFENEMSYGNRISAYHSLIYDSPLGPSTNGVSPGAGISHSYFTFHYQPAKVVSFDVYHNFFRDVPTAVTSIVGTGLVDKLLFQGVSAGTHVRPSRYFTLYTTLGTSKKTGDTHSSLNEMFGGTLNEIPRTGLRADFHYSKFDSNFGSGHYEVLSLSRQVTNRTFWNLQVGKQDVESAHTLNCDSIYLDDSFDINLGRHSYLQSGYTYVNGETMNYRQWYMSWGYRFDQGKTSPQYVRTMVPHN